MTSPRPLRAQAGFSLIELAVVLVIIGLLVGGGIAALTSATEQTRRVDAKRQMQHVRDALYGFAMSEGRLPCPDTDDPPDGQEDHDGTNCDLDRGALPWVDLGVGRRDPWGSPLHYRIDTTFANPTATFDLSTDGNVRVVDGDDQIIVDDAPAAVVSYGPQGPQVWTDSGFVCPAAGAATGFSADENENCDNVAPDEPEFVAAEYRPPDVGDPTNRGEGRFDDIVMWIPLPVLKARMVDAGLLP